MNPQSDSPDEKLVVTPGGPRHADHVHLVLGGSSVSFDAQGNASVDAPGAASPVAGADLLVMAPGGRRTRSRLHLSDAGVVVDFKRTRRWSDTSAAIKHDLRWRRAQGRPKPPGPAANWITAAWWENTTGTPINSFVTTWQVPPMPASRASQLIYIFNGIEPADYSTILQPVLQWGDSGLDEDGVNRTGPFWTVASWIVPDPDGNVYHTPHIPVNPGDPLIGLITLTGQDGSAFNYSCEFHNVPGTSLPVANVPELTWGVITLEAYENNSAAVAAYDLLSASEYPATGSTPFTGITIQTGQANPSPGWRPDNIVTQFGENTVIVTDSASNGRVDIYY
jgi:hypothetical protein